jgi:photosystem II stability/assembly factor-like uncharacterized protein
MAKLGKEHSMAKKTKRVRRRRVRARRSQARQRTDQQDVRPRKIVPGIQGRSEWFAERTGRLPGSDSIQRLLSALKQTARITEAVQTPDPIVDQALDLLDRVRLPPRRAMSGFLVDSRGRVTELRVRQMRTNGGLSAVSRAFDVPKVAGEWSLIVLPVNPTTSSYLDLDAVIGADLSDRSNPTIIESFQYLAQQGVIVGRISKGGIYRAFAPPKHPWLRLTLDVLCRYWKWVRLDLALRRSRTPGVRKDAGIVDRICQLILCPPDYMRVRDPRIFSEVGTGLPPGYDPGEPGIPGDPGIPPEIGGPGNICDRCLGDFLGEIDVIGDLVVPPVLVKWCWRRRPRCSRWVSIGPFPDNTFAGIGRVSQIDVHPTNGNILLAGASGGGVWRSDNAGASWRPLMELEPTLTIGAVAFAPSNPDVIYAASGEDGGGWNPAWGGVGVYRSGDGGQHWTLATSVPSTRFSAIVVHPTAPDTIFVAGNSGLHKSLDGGLTWRTNPGLGSLFDGSITDLVIAHDNPSRLYIGVWSDGVYRSTTGGEQIGATPAFTRLDGAGQLPAGGAAGWTKLAIGRNGVDGSSFLAAKMGADGSRIFSTNDGGISWTELAPNVAAVSYDEWCSVIAVDPNDQDILYAGAAGALMRTMNGGANPGNWTSIAAGVHADQQDISFDPGDSRRIYLGNDGGVYRSTNRGTTWELASGRLAITQFYDIDIAERDKDIVAGGAQDNGIYYRNGVGAWRNISWGDGTQVAIDPTDPNIFYFSAQNGLPQWIRKSTDGGLTHQQIGQNGLAGSSSPWITIIKLDPTDPISNPATNRTMFVCGTSALFRSIDGGQNWQRVEDTNGNALTVVGTITALEFAPNNPSILYLGTSIGAVYRAGNGGAAATDWARIDTVGSTADALFPNTQIQALRINPLDASDVWVVFGGAGVSYTSRPGMIVNPLGISHLFRSRDAGTNWADVSGSFPSLSLPDVPTSAVALSDVDSEIAYAGTDVGVFRTTNGGSTWSGFQDGLPRSPVVELRYHRQYDRIFAATMGRGVYVRDV